MCVFVNLAAVYPVSNYVLECIFLPAAVSCLMGLFAVTSSLGWLVALAKAPVITTVGMGYH